MMTYATLAEVRAELDTNSTDTASDAYIQTVARWVTARIDEYYLSYTFFPYVGTKLFERDRLYDTTAILDMPLLSITSVTGFDGTAKTAWDGEVATEATADYYTEPLRREPITALVWMDNATVPFGTPTYTSRLSYLRIAGTWGYHTDYANAWLSSGDSLVSGVNDSVTTLTVADADGASGDGTTPRFSPGNLIRIGDEYMSVTTVNTTTNVLTVKRGVQGTTAAAHDTAAAIDVWQVETNIRRAALRWAAYVHARRGNMAQVSIDALGGTTTTFPQDMPLEVKNLLAMYPRLYQWSFQA